MEILEIELTGFLGLWLNNINYFKLTVVSRVVLLLGRNGCGKTRLMEQLHPFAIAKKDFSDNGSKRLKFKVHNTVYLTVSIYDGSSVKNTLTNITTGEVLHTDVNPTYHNEVIAKLTNWSLELHKLNCLSSEHLTSMRASDRKYWFSKLSESDLAYALKFYNKLREEQRDLVGAIKQLKIEISELQLKVTDTDAEYTQISMSLDSLNEKYAALSSQCDLVARDLVPATDADLSAALAKLTSVANDILTAQLETDPALEAMDEWTLVHQVGTKEAQYNHTLKIWTDLEQTLLDLTSNTEAVDDLRRWIHDDQIAIADIRAVIYNDNVRDSLINYQTDFSDILRAYSDYQGVKCYDKPVTNQLIQQQHTVLSELNAKYYRCEAFCQYAEDKIKEYESATKIQCPACTHEFVSGISEAQITELTGKLATAKSMLVTIGQQRATEHELLTKLTIELNAQCALESAIERLRDSSPIDYLILRNADFFSFVSVVRTLESDWKHHAKLIALEASKTSLELRLAKACKYTPEALESLKQRIEEAQHTHTLAKLEYQTAQLALSQLKDYYKQKAHAVELESALDICYRNAVSVEFALLSQAEYDDLSGELLRLTTLIDTTKSRYLLMHDNRVQLAQLTARLQTLTNEYAVCSTLVKAMGPEEGLLAKHLYRSITRVTDRMTAFIDQVWGYAIKVLPCQLDKGELDYQFPYLLKDFVKPVHDVSAASVGQRKLFDLAFLLTIYGVLGLGSMPLYLDEMLNGFDEDHKDSIIKYLNTMLERGVYSQMFMISHDPSIHFQLSQADYVVIDSNGISLPRVYNQNVIIDGV